jgi:hypothetical protein
MRKFKSGQGGARKGAGRPAGKKSVTARDRRVRLGIRLPAYVVAWIRDQDNNPGRVIELALWETYSKEIMNHEKGNR